MAILYQRHPEQQFRINRRAAGMAVEIRKMGPDVAQIDEAINRTQKVILGNVVFQRELIE